MRTTRAVGFREVCKRLDFSIRTGMRRMAAGTFPIPALPRKLPHSHHKFSSADLDRYLDESATDEARPYVRQRVSVQ